MTDPRHDPEMKAALDHFTVPPLPPGFTDRVVTAAITAGSDESATAVQPLARRASRRGPWRRSSRIAAAALAMSLISAAAAATGYLGDRVQTITRDLPVVGPMIAQVVPKLKPAPVQARAKPAPVKAIAPPLPAETAEALPLRASAPPAVRREIRREIIAERIATGLERRAERRAALGLPDRPPRPREAIRVLRRIPPEDRRAVIERVRELRAERASEGPAGTRPERPTMAEDSSLPIPDAQVTVQDAADAPSSEMAEGVTVPGQPEPRRRFRELRERRLEMRRQQQQ